MPRAADQSSHENCIGKLVALMPQVLQQVMKDVSLFSHVWLLETLNIIKKGMESADYKGPDDRQALIEAVEAMSEMRDRMIIANENLQRKTHQTFGHQFISKVKDGKWRCFKDIEDTFYEGKSTTVIFLITK